MGQHVEAGRQQLDLGGHHRQLALLGLAGMSDHADNVAPSQLGRVHLEVLLGLVGLGAGHHLQLDALAAQIVEDELGARLPDGMDSPRHTQGDILQGLAVLQIRLVLGDEVLQRDADVELVGIGIRGGGALQLLDGGGAQLEVLVR